MDKKNKNPNVPNLRFPNFCTPWKIIPISNLLQFQNGINGSPEQYGKGVKFISVGDILNNIYITYDNIKGLIDIDEKTLNNYSVTYGDILFQRSSEIINDIGRTNVYLDKNNIATFGGFVIRGKKIGQYNPVFFNYLLKSPSSRKSIIRLGAGAQHYNIGQENIKTLNFCFPDEIEQAKIACLFSKIDERIQIQIKIIDDYSSVKDYIIKQCFQKCKEYINLGNLFKYGKAGGTPKSTIKEFYDGNIPFMGISDITNQGKYISYTSKNITQKGLINSSAWLVPKNSLILSMYASVGLPAINKIPLATSQAMMSMIFDNDLDVEFVYYYLCYFKKSKIQSLLETGTQSNINADTVKSIKVPKLRADEKEKITNIFIKVDQLINNEKEILNSLQKQKNFLLKNMFV